MTSLSLQNRLKSLRNLGVKLRQNLPSHPGSLAPGSLEVGRQVHLAEPRLEGLHQDFNPMDTGGKDIGETRGFPSHGRALIKKTPKAGDVALPGNKPGKFQLCCRFTSQVCA